MDKVKEYFGVFKGTLKAVNDYMAAFAIICSMAANGYMWNAYSSKIEENQELIDMNLTEYKVHSKEEIEFKNKLNNCDKKCDSLLMEIKYLQR
jgi:hypothetical protein